ncbi:hypothetical protein Tco_0479371 [Tanacetum coccineum]
MSTSATSIRRRRVIPTHCQCNMPLVRRVAWTDTNPCRRFLNCRFSNIAGTTRCNSFYWIDPELTNPWYKTQMFEIYLTLNPEERYLYHNQIIAQNQLENFQNEFEVYQHDMQMQIENMELKTWKLDYYAVGSFVVGCVCNEFAVGSFGVGSFGVSVIKDLLLCL